MSTALFEHSYYIGNYMSGILYGVDMVMYFMTLRQLVHRRRQKKSWRFFFWYSTALFVTLTIDISINAVWGENMWITNRDKPGGVPVFIGTQLSDWYQAWGSSAAVLLVFMSDALLIYRLFVIYNSSFLVIIVPCLTYIVGLVFAILELVASFKPGGFFFGKKSVNFGIPYYALTISLNIIVTSLICLRLFSLSRVVRQTMGEAHARTYTSVAAIMVESAAPYSLFGIAFLIPYARGSLVSITFGQVWAKITCLAPSLIILRVVTDKAWTKETFAQTGTAGAGFSSFNVRQQTTTVPDTMNSLNSDTIAGSYAAESKKGNSAASLPMSVAKASV